MCLEIISRGPWWQLAEHTLSGDLDLIISLHKVLYIPHHNLPYVYLIWMTLRSSTPLRDVDALVSSIPEPRQWVPFSTGKTLIDVRLTGVLSPFRLWSGELKEDSSEYMTRTPTGSLPSDICRTSNSSTRPLQEDTDQKLTRIQGGHLEHSIGRQKRFLTQKSKEVDPGFARHTQKVTV